MDLAINIIFTAVMVWLFVWDYKSFNTPTHKDFKSSIMTIGVLGTFVGIFVGLMGFDTHNIVDSVPTLLDGLKIAFYTSILGMGLAIALSVFQRSKNVKTDDESNLEYLAQMSENLKYLQEIPKYNQKSLELLESGFGNIESVLKESMKDLANGANKELISALESVIRDFNHNLTTQFGENFKELNSAVAKLLSWQENYKNSIIEIESSLKDATLGIQASSSLLSQISKDKEQIMAFYKQVTDMILCFKDENTMLKNQLESLALLGSRAKEMLNSVDMTIDKTKDVFELLNTKILEIQDVITSASQNIATEMLSDKQSIKEYFIQNDTLLRSSIKDNLTSITTDIQNSLNTISTSAMENAKTNADLYQKMSENIAERLDSTLNMMLESLNLSYEKHSSSLAKIQQEIAKNHKDISMSLVQNALNLEGSNTKMLEATMLTLQDMQEAHITTLKNHSLESIKSLQDVQNLQVSNAKEITATYDKVFAAQYENMTKYLKLNVIDFIKVLQKLSDETLNAPKIASEKLIDEFKKLQENMLGEFVATMNKYNLALAKNAKILKDTMDATNKQTNEDIKANQELSQSLRKALSELDEGLSQSSNKFKKDYEWFLLRIRELIGVR